MNLKTLDFNLYNLLFEISIKQNDVYLFIQSTKTKHSRNYTNKINKLFLFAMKQKGLLQERAFYY